MFTKELSRIEVTTVFSNNTKSVYIYELTDVRHEMYSENSTTSSGEDTCSENSTTSSGEDTCSEYSTTSSGEDICSEYSTTSSGEDTFSEYSTISQCDSSMVEVHPECRRRLFSSCGDTPNFSHNDNDTPLDCTNNSNNESRSYTSVSLHDHDEYDTCVNTPKNNNNKNTEPGAPRKSRNGRKIKRPDFFMDTKFVNKR